MIKLHTNFGTIGIELDLRSGAPEVQRAGPAGKAAGACGQQCLGNRSGEKGAGVMGHGT